MIIVPVTLERIKNKGIGIVAKYYIPEGAVIWRIDNLFRKSFTREEYNSMNKRQKAFMQEYALFHKGKWHVDLDNIRFINHSGNPNVKFRKGLKSAVSLMPIAAGQELTCNYLESATDVLHELWFECYE